MMDVKSTKINENASGGYQVHYKSALDILLKDLNYLKAYNMKSMHL